MKSWVVRLCASTAGVSPEAKFYLANFISQYGDQVVRRASDELGRRLGISARVTSRVVVELVSAGHLIQEQAPLTGRVGKPATELRVKPGLLEAKPSEAELKSWEDKDEGGHFEHIIERLLAERSDWTWGKPLPNKAPSQKGAAQRLSASNRLLLMILLGVAGGGGVIRNWRPSVLAELAGLTKVAFQGQVGKLTDLGYLRTVVAGVSGQSLFGIQSGAFFMNLSHPHYQGVIPEVVLLYPVEAVELTHRSQGDGWVIYQQLQALRQQGTDIDWNESTGHLLRESGITSASELEELAHHFDGVGTSTLADYLQMKVEEYAACLLPYGQGEEELEQARGRLEKIIDHELWPRGYRGGIAMRSKLVRLTLNLAERLAGLIWTPLKNTAGLEGPAAEAELLEWIYTIIPAISGANDRYLAITAVRTHPGVRLLGYRELVQEEGLWWCRPCGIAMPDEAQYAFGLRTAKKQPQRSMGSDEKSIVRVRKNLRSLSEKMRRD